MAEVTIFGAPQSTYLRTACMTCIEKGVSYDQEVMAPQSPEMLALNPTGKVPAFRHNALDLYETSAITRYVDEQFAGPKLQPADIVTRAEMNKWISQINDTIYQTMVRDIILPRFGIREADDKALSEAATKLNQQLELLDGALQKQPYLAGGDLTLADLFLAPILYWLNMTPEGQAALPKYKALDRWYSSIGERESFKQTVPPMPEDSGS